MAAYFLTFFTHCTVYRCVIIILFLPLSLRAQIDSLAEEMMNDDDEQGSLVEWIETLTADPLDINNASSKLIAGLPYLRPFQVELIIKNRPFSSKAEIAALLGRSTYEKIKLFIVLKKSGRFPQAVFTHRMQQILEKSRAFEEGMFTGTPYESMSRLQMKFSGSFSAGLLIQKDIGERLWDDHLSGYIYWHPPFSSLKIIAGNFYIHCAEGLLFSSSYLPSEKSLIKQSSNLISCRLKPFLSTNENSGFCGAALQWTLPEGIELTAFYSEKKRDAVLHEDTGQILRLEQSGYHRNDKEMNSVNTVQEKSAGLILTIPVIQTALVGLNFASTHFSPGFSTIKDPEQKRREYFRFEGSQIENVSVFYSFQYRLVQLMGEIAPAGYTSSAQMHSMSIGQPGCALFLRFSYYPPDFYSAHGRFSSDSNPFPHGSRNFFIGLSSKPFEGLDLSALCSSKKDLWRTYFNPMPLLKKRYELNASLHMNQKTRFLLNYSLTDEGQFYEDRRLCRTVRKGRFQIEKKIGSYIQIRSRVEICNVRHTALLSHKSGFNFYQDIRIRPAHTFSFSLRFSSFQCDDYDARIYEFESGIPGVFSNYPLYDSGNKFYVILSLGPLPYLKLWLKYRQIYFDGAAQVGSGLSAIKGPLRQDLQFQIEFKY